MKMDWQKSDFPFHAMRGPECTQHPQIDSSIGLVVLYITVMTQTTLWFCKVAPGHISYVKLQPSDQPKSQRGCFPQLTEHYIQTNFYTICCELSTIANQGIYILELPAILHWCCHFEPESAQYLLGGGGSVSPIHPPTSAVIVFTAVNQAVKLPFYKIYF